MSSLSVPGYLGILHGCILQLMRETGSYGINNAFYHDNRIGGLGSDHNALYMTLGPWKLISASHTILLVWLDGIQDLPIMSLVSDVDSQRHLMRTRMLLWDIPTI